MTASRAILLDRLLAYCWIAGARFASQSLTAVLTTSFLSRIRSNSCSTCVTDESSYKAWVTKQVWIQAKHLTLNHGWHSNAGINSGHQWWCMHLQQKAQKGLCASGGLRLLTWSPILTEWIVDELQTFFSAVGAQILSWGLVFPVACLEHLEKFHQDPHAMSGEVIGSAHSAFSASLAWL